MGTRGGMSRERFFFIAFLCSFAWYFLPGYLFGALSYFSWVTWIAPDNVPVNQMFGYVHGLGMSLITFDWAQVCLISFLEMQDKKNVLIRLLDRVYWVPAGDPVVG